MYLKKGSHLTKEQIILLLEGFDKSGKTHLGKRLSSALCIPYYHGERAPMMTSELRTRSFDVARIEMLQMHDILQQTGVSIIIDRWHLSEWVYSKVYGRPIDEEFLWNIDAEFAELGAIIIWCSASEELIRSRFNEEKIVNINDREVILNYYNEAFRKTKCMWIPYTSEVSTIESVVHNIISLLLKYRRLNVLRIGG